MASTSASSVSRLMEKPNAAIIANAPISESGIAITGISTERGEPRKANTTKVTITIASSSASSTSWIEAFTNSVES